MSRADRRRFENRHRKSWRELERHRRSRPGLLVCLRVVDGVELVLWPDTISPEFFGISDPADVAWPAARLTPHPWKCFTQKLILRDEAAVRRIPRTNINCRESLARSSDEARQRQQDGEHAWEIDTGHDLMITEPAKVADMLLKLA